MTKVARLNVTSSAHLTQSSNLNFCNRRELITNHQYVATTTINFSIHHSAIQLLHHILVASTNCYY